MLYDSLDCSEETVDCVQTSVKAQELSKVKVPSLFQTFCQLRNYEVLCDLRHGT